MLRERGRSKYWSLNNRHLKALQVFLHSVHPEWVRSNQMAGRWWTSLGIAVDARRWAKFIFAVVVTFELQLRAS